MKLFYTDSEGGIWQEWPEDVPEPTWPWLEQNEGLENDPEWNGITIHSLLFLERWDRLNGVTPEITYVKGDNDVCVPCPRCNWPYEKVE